MAGAGRAAGLPQREQRLKGLLTVAARGDELSTKVRHSIILTQTFLLEDNSNPNYASSDGFCDRVACK